MFTSINILFDVLTASIIIIGADAFQTQVPYPRAYHTISIVSSTCTRDNEDLSAQEPVKSTDSTRSIPASDLNAENVVIACIDAMLQNDVPWSNAGLETCFDFSSDRCRAGLGGSLDEFISYASNPTFGSMINAQSYEILSVGPIIAGTATRGAMQTVLVRVTPAKGGDRRFLWCVSYLLQLLVFHFLFW
jgi:hypothetical protein